MSDIVIRGIEMPKTGSRIIEINFRGEVFEFFRTDYERGGFLKNRKLEAVELPEPHGRIIDADKAKEAMMYEMCGTGYQARACYVLESDLYVPTIVEASE